MLLSEHLYIFKTTKAWERQIILWIESLAGQRYNIPPQNLSSGMILWR